MDDHKISIEIKTYIDERIDAIRDNVALALAAQEKRQTSVYLAIMAGAAIATLVLQLARK